MKTLLLFSFLVATSVSAQTQTPAQPPATQKPPAPATQKPPATPPATPAAPRPRPAQRAEPAGRSGMAMVVTDMRGGTLANVHVDLDGPTVRMGETNASGQLNFPGLQAGTYRLRFSGEAVTSFEREVTLRAGQVTNFDITLSPAPAPKVIETPAPAPTPTAAPTGPLGMPQSLSLYDLAEKELSSKQARREVLVACSGNLRSTLVILNTQDQPQRLYENAEVSYYVLGGQALVRVGDKENTLAAGGYVAVPRGQPFSIARRGRGPLSLLSVLSGEPCEEAK